VLKRRKFNDKQYFVGLNVISFTPKNSQEYLNHVRNQYGCHITIVIETVLQ